MNNNIIERLERIEAKLDAVIAALHEYDDENNLHCEYSGLPSVKAYDEKDIMVWDVDGAERRTHHVTNEEADDDARSNNIQTKHVGEKKRNKRYYKPKAK